jgi:RNA 3'-terminal phosphate cyclase (ATP)
MVEIDGSFGEGGGQILRTSLALSAITGKPFVLRKIRAGRHKPGLQPQHLASTRAAAAICQAETRGAAIQSRELTFEPGAVIAGSYHFPIETAGALSLVLHTVYLPLALRGGAASELHLTGGTHVKASPCFHFLDTTWRGYLALLGLQIDLRLDRPGFYPRGGGAVFARIHPCPKPKGIQLTECGAIRRITGVSAVAGLPEHISRRMTGRAAVRIHEHGLHVLIKEEIWRGGPGAVLNLMLDTTPVPTLISAVGERGKSAEQVADDAVEQFLDYWVRFPAGVDPHSADQLVLPLALADEPSTLHVASVTQHLLTNITVIRRFIDREIICEGAEGEQGVVRIGSAGTDEG